MQGGDLLLQVSKASRIGEDVVCCRQPFRTVCLRRHHSARLFRVDRVAGLKSFQLRAFRGVDDQNAVDQVAQAVLHQQRHHEDLVRPRRLLRPTAEFGADGRMEDVLKQLSLRGICENVLALATSIEMPGRIQYPGSKQGHDSCKSGLARLHQLPGDHIGIDDWNAKVGELVGHGGFAAGNATRQPDAQDRSGHLGQP